jgi:hypothetical protein
VKPNPGTATATYYRALSEGDAKHYRHELPPLQALADRMPDNTYVKDDIVAVQSATLGGQDRTPPDLVPYWPIAAGASGTVLALVLAVLVVRLLVGRRQQAPQVPPPDETLGAPFTAEPVDVGAPEAATTPQSDVVPPGGAPT